MMLRDELRGCYKVVKNTGRTNIRATCKQNHKNMAQRRESRCLNMSVRSKELALLHFICHKVVFNFLSSNVSEILPKGNVGQNRSLR